MVFGLQRYAVGESVLFFVGSGGAMLLYVVAVLVTYSFTWDQHVKVETGSEGH